jgi:hypothetical protein
LHSRFATAFDSQIPILILQKLAGSIRLLILIIQTIIQTHRTFQTAHIADMDTIPISWEQDQARMLEHVSEPEILEYIPEPENLEYIPEPEIPRAPHRDSPPDLASHIHTASCTLKTNCRTSG